MPRNRHRLQKELHDPPLHELLQEAMVILQSLDEALPVTLRLPLKTITPESARRVGVVKPRLETSETTDAA